MVRGGTGGGGAVCGGTSLVRGGVRGPAAEQARGGQLGNRRTGGLPGLARSVGAVSRRTGGTGRCLGGLRVHGGGSGGTVLQAHGVAGHFMGRSLGAGGKLGGERGNVRCQGFYHEMKDSNVLDKVALVYGQMNEPPGNRLRVALTGLTMAEKFRDEGNDVLLFVDNI